MMFRVLLTALLFANIHWNVAQDDEVMESTSAPEESTTEMMSTEDEMSSTELESTEDYTSSTEYGSDSGSDSDDDEEEESAESGDDSSDLSTTGDSDSDSDDSSATESSEDDDSSDDDESSATESSEDDDTESQDDVASEDDDVDDGEDDDDDGSALESEEDDQDTDDESTEGPEDDTEDTEDGVEVLGDDEDACVGLDADECGSTFGDDGAQLCGYNTMTDDCYEVVMTAGTRGKGNFDDGYTAAQAQADEQTAQLYTAIGILGGIMGILVLTVLGGGYYIYSNKKDIEYQHTPVTMDVIDVDGGSTRTKGHHMRIQSHSQHYTSDSMPMLDTM